MTPDWRSIEAYSARYLLEFGLHSIHSKTQKKSWWNSFNRFPIGSLRSVWVCWWSRSWLDDSNKKINQSKFIFCQRKFRKNFLEFQGSVWFDFGKNEQNILCLNWNLKVHRKNQKAITGISSFSFLQGILHSPAANFGPSATTIMSSNQVLFSRFFALTGNSVGSWA